MQISGRTFVSDPTGLLPKSVKNETPRFVPRLFWFPRSPCAIIYDQATVNKNWEPQYERQKTRFNCTQLPDPSDHLAGPRVIGPDQHGYRLLDRN